MRQAGAEEPRPALGDGREAPPVWNLGCAGGRPLSTGQGAAGAPGSWDAAQEGGCRRACSARGPPPSSSRRRGFPGGAGPAGDCTPRTRGLLRRHSAHSRHLPLSLPLPRLTTGEEKGLCPCLCVPMCTRVCPRVCVYARMRVRPESLSPCSAALGLALGRGCHAAAEHVATDVEPGRKPPAPPPPRSAAVQVELSEPKTQRKERNLNKAKCPQRRPTRRHRPLGERIARQTWGRESHRLALQTLRLAPRSSAGGGPAFSGASVQRRRRSGSGQGRGEPARGAGSRGAPGGSTRLCPTRVRQPAEPSGRGGDLHWLTGPALGPPLGPATRPWTAPLPHPLPGAGCAVGAGGPSVSDGVTQSRVHPQGVSARKWGIE